MPGRSRRCTSGTAYPQRLWHGRSNNGCPTDLVSVGVVRMRAADRGPGGKMNKQTWRGITRRTLMLVGAGLPACAVVTQHPSAAEFRYKLATGQDPTHPVNIRAQEAINRIREATDGRLEIRLFPANQLGSDTDLLSQVRSGGVELFNLSSSILATLVPVTGIVNTGFAFSDYDAV